jgi:hypothetical protein
LTTSLTSKEIERKRILVSKFKEDAINHIEIQELIAILKKEEQYQHLWERQAPCRLHLQFLHHR